MVNKNKPTMAGSKQRLQEECTRLHVELAGGLSQAWSQKFRRYAQLAAKLMARALEDERRETRLVKARQATREAECECSKCYTARVSGGTVVGCRGRWLRIW